MFVLLPTFVKSSYSILSYYPGVGKGKKRMTEHIIKKEIFRVSPRQKSHTQKSSRANLKDQKFSLILEHPYLTRQKGKKPQVQPKIENFSLRANTYNSHP